MSKFVGWQTLIGEGISCSIVYSIPYTIIQLVLLESANINNKSATPPTSTIKVPVLMSSQRTMETTGLETSCSPTAVWGVRGDDEVFGQTG